MRYLELYSDTLKMYFWDLIKLQILGIINVQKPSKGEPNLVENVFKQI